MKEKFVSPLYDFAFAEIFGNQRNIDNTIGFLKAVLDIPEDEYGRLTVVNPVLRRFFRKDKMGIVDLNLTTKHGKTIHIELQVEKKPDMKNRIVYYIARLIGDQLKWGENYNKLRQVISIVICDHNLLEEESRYMNEYELRNNKNHSFTEIIKLVILELPKLTETEDSIVWHWLRFLKCRKKEEFEMLAREYPDLEKPISCARKLSFFEKWFDIRYHNNLWKTDERQRLEQLKIDSKAAGRAEGLAEGRAEGLAEGRAEGKAEGIAEGRAESKLEIAHKMKSRGRPLEEIVEDTGLSIETVEKL